MQKGHLLALLSIFLIGTLVFLNTETSTKGQSHNLITRTEAEAYVAFEKWIITHGKIYREQEEKNYRFEIFLENYRFIKESNQKYESGEVLYELSVNQFADLHNKEFKYLYAGLKNKEHKIQDPSVTKSCKDQSVQILQDLPDSVDWRSKAVGSVRNQGQCGSCWAFSAVGAIEGLYAIEKNTIQTLSVQQLVDCAGGPYENEGCNGGQMDAAFWYVIDNGITTEKQYAYTAKTGTCHYKAAMKAYQINSCEEVTANSTKALQSAVAKQPVSIGVEADTLVFQFYSKGILSNPKCGQDLDHGILLTGYGADVDGHTYWECKNSWGPSWGMQGYLRIQRDETVDGGICGILMENSLPLNE